MFRRSLALVALAVLSATSLAAADRPQSPAPPSADTAVQAAVDENGQLRQPTLAEQKALQSMRPDTVLRLKPVTHSNGMVSIALDEAFDHAFVVRTESDGSLAYVCTDDHAAAASFVAQTAQIESIMRIKPATARQTRTAERE